MKCVALQISHITSLSLSVQPNRTDISWREGIDRPTQQHFQTVRCWDTHERSSWQRNWIDRRTSAKKQIGTKSRNASLWPRTDTEDTGETEWRAIGCSVIITVLFCGLSVRHYKQFSQLWEQERGKFILKCVLIANSIITKKKTRFRLSSVPAQQASGNTAIRRQLFVFTYCVFGKSWWTS